MLDKNKLILVIGGFGTIGKKLIKRLAEENYSFASPGSNKLNLEHYDATYDYISTLRPDIVINLAGVKTNIKKCAETPFDIYADTVCMNNNLFRAIAGQPHRPEKVLSVVCSCSYSSPKESYPDNIGEPFYHTLKEDNFDFGRVHESVAAHGYAKRSLYYMSKFIRQQYDIKSTCVVFNNVYSGTDWTRPDTFKVLEALVKKFVDAKVNNHDCVTIWGSGEPRREFIHVDDCVTGIIRTLDMYDGELLNIGCGYDIAIRQLAEGIKLAVGYEGEIVYNKDMPDGQMKKLMDNSLMRDVLQWSPEVSLCEGVQQTIYSYYNYLGEGVGR